MPVVPEHSPTTSTAMTIKKAMDRTSFPGIELGSRVRQGVDQVSCEVNGEVIILHMQEGRYFGLDPVGARIWEIIDGAGATVLQIRDTLLAEYEVDEERCTRELIAVLQQMTELELVTVTGR